MGHDPADVAHAATQKESKGRKAGTVGRGEQAEGREKEGGERTVQVGCPGQAWNHERKEGKCCSVDDPEKLAKSQGAEAVRRREEVGKGGEAALEGRREECATAECDQAARNDGRE